MFKPPRVRRVACVMVALALSAAACGGDDDSSDPGADDTAAAPVTAQAAPSSPPTTEPTTDTDEAPEPTAATSATTEVAAPAETPAPTTPAVDVDRSATITVAHGAPPATFDPPTMPNQFSGTLYGMPIYDRLVRLTADNTIEPMVAESWELSDDGLTLTMSLRDDVVFHDGTPLDADAVVAGLTRTQGTEGVVGAQLAGIAGIEALDPATVQFTLVAADETVLYVLASLAGALVSPTAVAEGANIEAEGAGSGPYILETAGPEGATYIRNEDYWDPSRSLAAKLVIQTVTDTSARLNAMQSGQLDAAVFSDKIAELVALGETDEYDLYTYQNPNSLPMLINTSEGPLSDPRVRLALNHAIDREGFNQAIMNGQCPPTSQAIPPGFAGNDGSLEPYEYDLDLARQLLEEAGVGEFTINAVAIVTEPHATVASLMKESFSQVGVTLDYTLMPGPEARPLFRTGDYDAYIGALSTFYPDPSAVYDAVYLGPDNVGGATEELIAAATEARRLPLGSDERAAAYAELEQQQYEEPTHVYVCGSPVFVPAKSDIVGADQLAFASAAAIADVTTLGRRN
jgi:peptide/nickel transport system substrate-binding protein